MTNYRQAALWIATVDASSPGRILFDDRPSLALDPPNVNHRRPWQVHHWILKQVVQKLTETLFLLFGVFVASLTLQFAITSIDRKGLQLAIKNEASELALPRNDFRDQHRHFVVVAFGEFGRLIHLGRK